MKRTLAARGVLADALPSTLTPPAALADGEPPCAREFARWARCLHEGRDCTAAFDGLRRCLRLQGVC